SCEVIAELVRGTLEAVRSIGIADNYIAHFVNAKLDVNDFGQNGLDVALYLAYALPSSCINEFLLTAERLSTQLSYLREYDVEILERNAFLSASVELDLYSLCNSSYARRELPTKQMRRAIFLLSYIRNKGMFTDDSANTELVYALLFCVAVSCMVGFENAIERRSASAQMLALEEAVKETVMLNENGRRLLLRSAVQFALEHSISLTLLLALRQLGDGLDLSQIGNDLRSRIRDDGLRQRICCAASAVALKAVCDPIEWDVSCANDWVCRCELDSSLANSDSSTLLACFVCEGRSFFEGSLFIFQESEEGTDVNALNCALLRVLQRSCSSLDVMGSALRDFLLCALITALESCKIQSKHDHYAHFFLLFASLTIRLFIGCSRTAESTKEDPSFSEFRQEWNEFYRQAAEGIVVEWFLSLSERVAISHPALLRVLSSATHYCEESTFHDAKLPPRFDVELDCKNYPEWLQSIVIPLVPLFSHPLVDVQFAALRILRAVTVEMMLLENRSEEKEEEADESLALVEKKNLPVILTRILNSSPEAKADVPPVLLAWDAFVESLARFQLTDRVAYCNSMNVVLDDVMSKIFELLPQNPHACDIVLDYSLFRIERSHSGLPILSQYVFGLFYRTLTTLPALIRQWYTSLPRAAANLVDMYTTKHVAPLIWKKERDLISVQKMPRSLEVRVLGAVREIVAEYDLEDAKMTLLVELPADYPLSVPIIENENAIVNRDVKRKWLLQLTLFLAHQNGSVMDGILMWAKNIARHLEGAEDCTICMMTVHSKTLQLPRIRCKQCKNRFHADCLRKWFETSSQSTCPLCRSNFRTAQL
ncbi:E3 ubiquitin-protein ligase listerin, partial [Toxocara canis]